MITLSNGHCADFFVSSGALGFDGDDSGHGLMKLWKKPFRWLGLLRPEEFTIITKTVTFAPRKGNLTLLSPWQCVRKIKGGWVNSVGFTNPSYIKWFADSYKKIIKRGYKVIVSIAPDTPQEASLMCSFLNECQDLVGVQINSSCPNVEYGNRDKLLDILWTANCVTVHPLLIKLGCQDDCVSLLKIIEDEGINVEAVELINSVPWSMLHPDIPSPLAKYGLGGGVSGRPISLLARKVLHDVKQSRIRTPVISGGGIYDYEELLVRHNLGADAFAIGTLFINRPWLPNVLVSKYRKEYGHKPNERVAS